MKRELWPKVKIGTWVIYADEYDGVFKAKVIEINIVIYEPGEPSRRGYPYGMTAETGAVRIQYNTITKIENLADLIKYDPTRYAKLRKDWDQWQSYKATAEGLRETFLARVQEYKGY